MPSPRKISPAKGFSLIEAAIVLGILALVIGGIWIAAETVNEDSKVNATISGIEFSVDNLQRLISVSGSVSLGAIDLTPTAMSAGVFPSSWLSGTGVRHPFGGDVMIGNQSGRFDFNLKDLYSNTACVKLVMKISSIGAAAGRSETGGTARPSLGYVMVNDGAPPHNYITTFPIPVGTAATECAVVTEIALGFGFTRTN